MGKRVGVITMDIDAGTAQFLAEMDAANGKLAQFGKTAGEAGHQTVTAMQASSAAIREMAGGSNIRAVERFMSTLPGMGNLMLVAFKPIAAFATAGLFVKMGSEAVEFFRKMEQAPERIANAFRQINAPLKLTNDELALSNQRLSNDIAKLEGKPQNGLAEALLAAKAAADKLGDSLDRDLSAFHKMMEENKAPFWQQMFKRGTDDVDKREFGDSGEGGKYAEINATDDPTAKLAILQAEIAFMNGELGKVKAQAAEAAKPASTAHAFAGDTSVAGAAKAAVDYDGAIKRLNEYLTKYQGLANQIEQEQHNAELTAKKDVLAAGAAARKRDEETTLRLAGEIARVREQQASAMERIDIAERAELERLQAEGQITKQHLNQLHERFDTERLTEYNKLLEEQTQHAADMLKISDGIRTPKDGLFGGILSEATLKQIEVAKSTLELLAGTKKEIEEGSRPVTELARQYNEISGRMNTESVRHGSAMAGIGTDQHDPIAMLKAEQAAEKLNIELVYEQQLKLASNNEWQKGIVLREKELALQKLQNHYEEEAAALRQQKIDQVIDAISGDVSGELTKLMTGEHTSWGNDAKQAGRSLLQSGLKNLLQHGLSNLGHHVLKPTGTAGDPIHVVDDTPDKGTAGASLPGPGLLPMIPGGGPGGGLFDLSGAAASGIGGYLAKLFGGGGGGGLASVSSSISYLAEGGDVYAGNNYVVGDGGEPEVFSPGVSGHVTPMSKMGGGGDQHYYTIDARGTDPVLTEMRVRQAIVAAHNNAIATSVQANSERAKRTVQS